MARAILCVFAKILAVIERVSSTALSFRWTPVEQLEFDFGETAKIVDDRMKRDVNRGIVSL